MASRLNKDPLARVIGKRYEGEFPGPFLSDTNISSASRVLDRPASVLVPIWAIVVPQLSVLFEGRLRDVERVRSAKGLASLPMSPHVLTSRSNTSIVGKSHLEGDIERRKNCTALGDPASVLRLLSSNKDDRFDEMDSRARVFFHSLIPSFPRS